MYNNKFVATIQVGDKTLRDDKDGNVYIPFNTEYEIYLSNLNSQTAVVTIEIDGDEVTKTSNIVVRPNQRTKIKGFNKALDDSLEDNYAFKFIEKTETISKYRGDKPQDGLIRIGVKYEQENPFKIDWNYTYKDYSYEWNKPIYYNSKVPYNFTGDDSSSLMRGSSNISFTASNNSMGCVNESSNPSVFLSQTVAPEGITTKGEYVKQDFDSTYVGPLEAKETVIIFQLHGQTKEQPVKKPITSRTKLVCEICGTRNKSLNKFCGECGTNLR